MLGEREHVDPRDPTHHDRGRHRSEQTRIQVGGGEHRDHTGRVPSGLGVDPHDVAPGEVAADEGRVHHAGDDDVVDVTARAP